MMDLLGSGNLTNFRNWTGQFEQKHKSSWSEAEILEHIKSLEKQHRIGLATAVLLVVLGGVLCSFFNIVIGFGFPLLGLFQGFATKLISSNTLCTFHILWDQSKRENEAITKSEIQDL